MAGRVRDDVLGLLSIGLKLNDWIAKRPLSSGPSLFPVVPVVVLTSFLLGGVVNHWLAPAGTVVVMSIHLLLILVVLAAHRRDGA